VSDSILWWENVMRGMIRAILKLHLCSNLKVVERQWEISVGNPAATDLRAQMKRLISSPRWLCRKLLILYYCYPRMHLTLLRYLYTEILLPCNLLNYSARCFCFDTVKVRAKDLG
jgi:hypothetical protein